MGETLVWTFHEPLAGNEESAPRDFTIPLQTLDSSAPFIGCEFPNPCNAELCFFRTALQRDDSPGLQWNSEAAPSK